VAREITQECLDHHHGGDERHHKTDRDDPQMIDRHIGAAFVKIVGKGADHGRDRKKERKLRRGAPVGAQQHRRDDAGAGP